MGEINIFVVEIKHSLVIRQDRKKYYTGNGFYLKFLLQLLGDIAQWELENEAGETGNTSETAIVNEMQ